MQQFGQANGDSSVNSSASRETMEKTNMYYLQCADQVQKAESGQDIQVTPFQDIDSVHQYQPPPVEFMDTSNNYYFTCWISFVLEAENQMGCSSTHLSSSGHAIAQLSAATVKSQTLANKLSVYLIRKANEYYKLCAMLYHMSRAKSFATGAQVLNQGTGNTHCSLPQRDLEESQRPSYTQLKLVNDFYVDCAQRFHRCGPSLQEEYSAGPPVDVESTELDSFFLSLPDL